MGAWILPRIAMSETTQLRVMDFDCPTCAGTVERALGNVEGVESVEVHYTTGRVEIEYVDGVADPYDFDPMEAARDGGDAGAGGDGDAAADFGGWFDDVDNFDGVVDRTGESEVTVEVGSPGNGGNFGYGPAAVRVDPGTTVTWEWVDGSHDVQAEDGSFKSTLTDEVGHTFSQRFDGSGVHKYYCMPHKAMGMKGAVIVA
jgi:nitrite reductase (NO-forming)